MESSDSQINKPQHGRPKRAELLDVIINTGAQSINTERTSFKADLHGTILSYPTSFTTRSRHEKKS